MELAPIPELPTRKPQVMLRRPHPLPATPYRTLRIPKASSNPDHWAITVPRAMPGKPRPCQVPMPRVRMMLAAMFTRFTVRSVSMLLKVSCMPMNQPLRTIRLSVAGAAQMRMRMYCAASAATPGVALRNSRLNFDSGHPSTSSTAAIPSASITPRRRID